MEQSIHRSFRPRLSHCHADYFDLHHWESCSIFKALYYATQRTPAGKPKEQVIPRSQLLRVTEACAQRMTHRSGFLGLPQLQAEHDQREFEKRVGLML